MGAAAPLVQVQQGTLDPGGQASYVGGKGPGFIPEPEEPADEGTEDDGEPEDVVTDGGPTDEGTTVDCSQYEEGTPMRILCEHDPTTNDISDEPVRPMPAPEDPDQ
jgi:hypothetical protein